MIKLLKFSAVTALFVIAAYVAMAQTQYKLNLKSSSMLVKGTSTIHDWEMKVEDFNGGFTLAENQVLSSLNSGNLVISVKSIKSDQNLMNKKTYEALKEEEHPQIKVKIIQVDHSQNKAQLELTIAGKTQKLNEDFQLVKHENGTLQIKGILEIKMSDYGIKPPVALMGTIKTNDEVKIAYDLNYHK
ncbi:YceI family protein [Gaoshiqia sp. Z1-71]|uniref:YceI family protein n=1 Tax=Gaoshiqia hydrogeniformans TaxID=3290090 RepID=UPI003BF858BD